VQKWSTNGPNFLLQTDQQTPGKTSSLVEIINMCHKRVQTMHSRSYRWNNAK